MWTIYIVTIVITPNVDNASDTAYDNHLSLMVWEVCLSGKEYLNLCDGGSDWFVMSF